MLGKLLIFLICSTIISDMNLVIMDTINLEYIHRDFSKWEDTIYDFLIYQIKEGRECLFSKVWAMMYGKGIIDENEKEDLEYEQKYFIPFIVAYDKAIQRFCKENNISFKMAFAMSFISHHPLSSEDDRVFATI